jgi:hypothetical protein
MFASIYSTTVTVSTFMTMAGIALLTGVIFAWIMSYKVKATKRFFLVSAILPFAVGAVITFVSGNIGAGVAMGGAFGLIRFRSAQGSADELASILIGMSAGIAFGMGYVAYGAMILIGLAVLYTVLSALPIFEHKGPEDKLLKVTIPESLDYYNVFDSTFDKYLEKHESVGVKTTGMGSMFKLSFRIRMKDRKQENAFIDEIRTMNGNLEVALLPYAETQIQL